MAYKYSAGQPYMYPKNKLSYTANFMHMMFATPCEEHEPNDVLVRAMARLRPVELPWATPRPTCRYDRPRRERNNCHDCPRRRGIHCPDVLVQGQLVRSHHRAAGGPSIALPHQ